MHCLQLALELIQRHEFGEIGREKTCHVQPLCFPAGESAPQIDLLPAMPRFGIFLLPDFFHHKQPCLSRAFARVTVQRARRIDEGDPQRPVAMFRFGNRSHRPRYVLHLPRSNVHGPRPSQHRIVCHDQVVAGHRNQGCVRPRLRPHERHRADFAGIKTGKVVRQS